MSFVFFQGTINFLITKNNTMPNTKTKRAPSSRTRSQTGSNGYHSQLEKLFTDTLKDIYWAEKHLLKELPKMQKVATTQELKDAFDEHTAQTEEHVTRLEQVFEMMGHKAQPKKCDGMEGIFKEGHTGVQETEDGSMTRDAGLIMSAQKVEHYEIATYGTLVSMANTLGMQDAAEILNTTLEEEKQTDQNLTEIAENDINWEAEQETEEEE
jgi:ferritin-like metal-binding protein YciE